ncbi:D-amino acid dehydrogenase [Paludibacterium paludis]|uniref:D-amino acid dehydrogenase small subunit n=1 Tax=Paludibacterium paludis TaxID=1225769 RepID=A0A918P648_9NEIS|nr:D-amino acid dehydrogenase [Paludibacterium paludis]GGY26070.1 D-amino acid dehydrogenase small subunit [Paludibacterium paludis]
MKILVLGAGVVGVSTAWFLARQGHEVVVVDRAAGAARETSFANGGQISVGQSEPWANPSAPWKVLKWLLRDDAPLLFRLKLDPAQWEWGLRFLGECLPGRWQRNMAQMVALGSFSQEAYREIAGHAGLDFDHAKAGIMTLFSTQRELDEGAQRCARLAELGIERRLVSREEMVAIEPALACLAPTLAGGAWCPGDESGDVHRFTTGLAESAARMGVSFLFQTRVNALLPEGGRITGVSVTGPDGHYRILTADRYVLAAGSYSPQLAATAGLRLPVYPAKGYSATVPVSGDGSSAPVVSLTDESHKLVFSRLGQRLRIAGTAELAGYSPTLNTRRCQALLTRARQCFPDAAQWECAEFWSGLRPATPGNVPLIGATRYGDLYLNTGHGTLGFTEGPGSGKALAMLIDGRDPGIDFDFLGMKQ